MLLLLSVAWLPDPVWPGGLEPYDEEAQGGTLTMELGWTFTE